MSKKDIVGKLPEKVLLVEEATGGEPFNTKGFTKGKTYRPIALFNYGFGGGENALCFSLPDDNGRIRNVIVSLFSIVEGA